MSRFINPVPQYLNSAGDPIVSGQMFFYEVGSTTPKDVYLDAALTIPAANPVLLNADGRMPDTYLLGSYRTILSEPSSGEQWERDNVGSEFTDGYGSEWNSTVTYNIPDVVLFDGVYYVCQTNNNVNNQPSSTSSEWSVSNLGAIGSNLIDNAQFKVRQRGNNDGGAGLGGVFIDRWITRPLSQTGGATQISVPTIGNFPVDYMRVAVSGHTSFWYIRQNFLTDKIQTGKDYTYAVKTNLMSSAIKMRARLRGRSISAGVFYTLGESDIQLDSYGQYTVTFKNVVSPAPLTAEDDYIQIELSGQQADGGADFVLPDGSYRFESFKLEEGNSFTGNTPSAYSSDELECRKWYRGIDSEFVATVASASATTATRRTNLFFDPPMYFPPTVTIGSITNGALSSISTTSKNGCYVTITASSSSDNVFVDGYTATCEIL